jgi:hypothetical protein
VSLPVFNGLATQRQLEQAQASARTRSRTGAPEELTLRTAVTEAYDNLVTPYQLIGLQDSNRQIAEERLAMARQRYAVGAANILELLDAQTSVQTAERDYLNALYDFQINLATLEAAPARASARPHRGPTLDIARDPKPKKRKRIIIGAERRGWPAGGHRRAALAALGRAERGLRHVWPDTVGAWPARAAGARSGHAGARAGAPDHRGHQRPGRADRAPARRGGEGGRPDPAQ